jgi:hypothetical protein
LLLAISRPLYFPFSNPHPLTLLVLLHSVCRNLAAGTTSGQPCLLKNPPSFIHFIWSSYFVPSLALIVLSSSLTPPTLTAVDLCRGIEKRNQRHCGRLRLSETFHWACCRLCLFVSIAPVSCPLRSVGSQFGPDLCARGVFLLHPHPLSTSYALTKPRSAASCILSVFGPWAVVSCLPVVSCVLHLSDFVAFFVLLLPLLLSRLALCRVSCTRAERAKTIHDCRDLTDLF